MRTHASGIAPRASGPSLAGTRLGRSAFLSHEERQALDAALLPSRLVRGGVELAAEGGRADYLFIVAEGWICQHSATSDGTRQFSAVIVPGDIANLDSLIFDRLDYGVRTLSDVIVVPLPRDRALALAARHPGIARTFTWLALVEKAILSRWVLSIGRRTATERLAHLLCELSFRLDAEEGNTSSFELPLTQEQIGDALGLTAVHTNRTLQQLRAERLIVTARRKVTLPDLARLRRIAGFEPGYLHMDGPIDAQPGRPS